MYLVFSPAARREASPGDAEQSLTELIDKHPQSKHAPWALFQLGRLALEKGEREEAVKRFQEVIDRYPNSDAVGIAKEYQQRALQEPGKEARGQ